jgi:hypothetical protein
MATRNNNNNARGNERDLTSNRGEQRSSVPNDLPDSSRDSEKLKPEETFIDLPDVSDIPGQENVSAPRLGEMADTTISSADEEGDELFDDDNEDEDVDFVMGTEGDVRNDERKALENDDRATRDEDNLRNARMDNVDFQGEQLNERSFGDERSGKDLDVPGTSADNRNEEIGEEDEENNEYSLGSDDNDPIAEGTP